ncbi:sugar transferase [uncultured Desulfosarcina sp.]|uniref:sugar transferase n=1 Tax=uncultured Desulfosarcina sp. TaxID=218289 RepID=UPI0029C88414|nr:sugar transferase [uncultured Desulfosarcina sp.]
MNSFPSVNNALRYKTIKRAFDLALGMLLLSVLAPLMIPIAITIRWTSPGPAIYWSWRVGACNRWFRMPKFRTMHQGTPSVATHLMRDPERFVTPIGRFLRKTSLDELPQLISVINGNMSFVGPRPALFNQDDLVALRTEKGVHRLVPGITGWAQINGRDELPIPAKVELDDFYLRHCSFALDVKILSMTVFSVAGSKGITH